MSNSTSAVLASLNTRSTPSVARPLARPAPTRPVGMPASRNIPDHRDGVGLLLNIADGTIQGETPGHVAVTIGGNRYETVDDFGTWITSLRDEVAAACTRALSSNTLTAPEREAIEVDLKSLPTDEQIIAAVDDVTRAKGIAKALSVKFGIRMTDLRKVSSSEAAPSVLSLLS